MKIASVSPLSDYKLYVRFDDGVSGDIELKNFIQGGIFSVLLDPDLFNNVYTTGYSVAWSDELEIDAVAIYAELLNKTGEVSTDSFEEDQPAYNPAFVKMIRQGDRDLIAGKGVKVAIDKLFIEKIEKGLQDIQNGKVLNYEEVKRYFKK